MKRIFLFLLCLTAIFFVVSKKVYGSKSVRDLKSEIMKVEEDFNKMTEEKGIKEAFLFFASEDAVIFRKNRLIKGKTKIAEYFDKSGISQVELKWKPDFIDVSKNGDLAYTYGKFFLKAKGPDGKLFKSSGIFHTVWKRMASGDWKYVWD